MFAVIALYLVGGAVAGVVVGILQPLARWKLGAAVVGVVATLPVGVGIVGIVAGFSGWGRDHTLLLVILSVSLGSFVGVGYREILLEDGTDRIP